MVLAHRARWRRGPSRKIRSPRLQLLHLGGVKRAAQSASCMSLSRGQPVPAAVSDTCTRPGAIDAEAALAAPQIGRAHEALGDGNEILSPWRRGGATCRAGRYKPSLRHGKRRRLRDDRHASRPAAASPTGGSLIDGPGNANVRSAVTLCVGVGRGLAPALHLEASRHSRRRSSWPQAQPSPLRS